MSETLFAAPVTEQAAPVAPAEEVQENGQRRKVLVVVAGAVVLVGAVGGFLLLKGGSSDSASSAPPIVHHAKPTTVTPKGSFNAKAFPTLPDVFKDVVGRDPFKPLVEPKPAAPAQAPAPTNIVVAGAPAPTGTTAGTPTGTTAAAGQPDWISLESENGTKSATFLVHSSDNKVVGYTDVAAPAQGKTTAFGGYFALLSLQNGFAVVQMGDGKPFAVQVGYTNRHMLN